MSKIIKEIQAKSILTKSNLPAGDYSVNPYVGCTHACRYCYASFMKRFTNHPEPWGDFLDIKHWETIKNPEKYAGKEVFIGSVTDPYVPQERQYLRTRAFLEQMKGSGIKLTIATRSDLVLRDLDLIKTYKDARILFSVNTLNESFKKDMEKSAPIEKRLQAMKAIHQEGVRTICFISPIFPEISEVKEIMLRVKDQCNFIWLENLNLRGEFKPVILGYIKEKYPQFLEIYQEIYQKGNNEYWERLNLDLKAFAEGLGLEYLKTDSGKNRPFEQKPIVSTYFYHEQITKSAQKAQEKIVQPTLF